jgi:hypothetical protein
VAAQDFVTHFVGHFVHLLSAVKSPWLRLSTISTARASLRLWPPSLRLPYGSFFDGAFKIISVFANSKTATPITANDCKGFTGRMSKITNLFDGAYGFTGKNTQGWVPITLSITLLAALPRRSGPRRRGRPVPPIYSAEIRRRRKRPRGGGSRTEAESDKGGSVGRPTACLAIIG